MAERCVCAVVTHGIDSDWLDGVSLPDGGLPFALPIPDPAACAPFWVSADPGVSSLQITAAVAQLISEGVDPNDAEAIDAWIEHNRHRLTDE